MSEVTTLIDPSAGVPWGTVHGEWDARFVRAIIGRQPDAVDESLLKTVTELTRELRQLAKSANRFTTAKLEEEWREQEKLWRESLLDPTRVGTVDKPDMEAMRKKFVANGEQIHSFQRGLGWKIKPACDALLSVFIAGCNSLLKVVLDEDRKSCSSWNMAFAPSPWAKKIYATRLAAETFIKQYEAHSYPDPGHMLSGIVISPEV